MRLQREIIDARIENLSSAVLVWTSVTDRNHEENEDLGRRAFLVVGGVSAILLLDQATKLLVAGRLSPGQSIEILPGFMHLTLVRNTGMAFGLFSDIEAPSKSVLMTLLSIVALALVVYYARSSLRGRWLTHAGVTFILGGALGNIADRVRLGYVIDFVDVFYRGAHWPAFNVADSCICIGVGLLLLDSLRRHEPASEERQQTAEPGGRASAGPGGPVLRARGARGTSRAEPSAQGGGGGAPPH